jgi:hypothetical protein
MRAMIRADIETVSQNEGLWNRGRGRRPRAVTEAHVRFAPKSERTVIIEIGPGLA